MLKLNHCLKHPHIANNSLRRLRPGQSATVALPGRQSTRSAVSRTHITVTAARGCKQRLDLSSSGTRSLWNIAKDWRADQQPKTSISESPAGPTMSPNFEYKYLAKPATVAIVGCPFSGGQGRAGVDLAPNRLISAGLVSQLAGLGWEVHYETQQSFVDIPYNPVPADSIQAKDKTVNGDANPTPAETIHPSLVQRLPDPDIGIMKKPRLVSAVCEKVSNEVGRIAEKGWLPLTLGGDHSLGLGTVAGTKSKYPNAALIWVDAHPDINTPLTTDSGNLHGCPVSFLLGLTGCDVEPFNKWVKPCLKPEELVYVGLRDIDLLERKILKENGIKVFTMHEIDKHGIGKVMQMALEYINKDGERPIHLSFDVDALDPSEAPSTGTPVRGGLTFREGHYITEAVAETGCLVGLDIVEVNPSLVDSVAADKTVAVGCSLARAALGETLL